MRRLLLALSLLVAACGDLPQPFRHEGVNAAVAPPGPRVVLVRPPDDGPSAAALAEAIVKRLAAMDIPASTSTSLSGGWVLAARTEKAGGSLTLSWHLTAPGEGEPAPFPQTLPTDLWRRAGPATIARMADDVVGRYSAILLGQAPMTAGDAPPRAPVVRIATLAGLPGDGNSALTKALGQALTRLGIRLGGSDADLEVRGRFSVIPGGPGQEVLAITWIVADGKDGRELGKAEQQGALPKGKLDGAWGALAGDIAAGGAEGVADIIAGAAQK